MNRFRISIAGMLGVVVVAGLGFAAGLMMSVTIIAMVSSLLGIAFRAGERRVYWVGFALLGWTYLGLTFTSWYTSIGIHLLGPNLFATVYDGLHGVENGPSGMQGLSGRPATGGGFRSMASGGRGKGAPTPIAWVAEPADLVRIGRCLEALVWAFLGGWTARFFAHRRQVLESTP